MTQIVEISRRTVDVEDDHDTAVRKLLLQGWRVGKNNPYQGYTMLVHPDIPTDSRFVAE